MNEKKLKQKYEEAGDSLVSGVESFTMQAFGGPLGGIINALTIGFVKRRRESAKQEKIKAVEEKKKIKEEAIYNKKLLRANAENILRSKMAKEQGIKLSEVDDEIFKKKEAELVEIEKNLEESQVIREKKEAELKLKKESAASEEKLKTDIGEKVDTDKGTNGFLESAKVLDDDKKKDVGVKKSKET